MTSHTASCGPLLGVLALPLQHQGAYIVPGLLIVLVVAAITQGELEKGKNKGGNSGTTKSSFLLNLQSITIIIRTVVSMLREKNLFPVSKE